MEHRYLTRNKTDISGATFVINKEVFNKVKFRDGKGNGRDTDFILDCHKNNLTIYSADRFNYLGRRFASKADHTWKMNDIDILYKSFIVAYIQDCIPHITC